MNQRFGTGFGAWQQTFAFFRFGIRLVIKFVALRHDFAHAFARQLERTRKRFFAVSGGSGTTGGNKIGGSTGISSLPEPGSGLNCDDGNVGSGVNAGVAVGVGVAVCSGGATGEICPTVNRCVPRSRKRSESFCSKASGSARACATTRIVTAKSVTIVFSSRNRRIGERECRIYDALCKAHRRRVEERFCFSTPASFATRTQMTLRGFTLLVSICCCASSAFSQLTAFDVNKIVTQAATRAAQISPNSVIAVTDREGYVLGVWNVRGGQPTRAEIATCVSKAGTAAFLSSDQNAFTSRTAGFIIQQHFPPGVRNTPTGPLVGVGLSNLFISDVNRFKQVLPNPTPTPIPPPSPGILGGPVFGTSLDGSPGGVPLYKNGRLVGGVGVTGDGTPLPSIAPDFRAENPFVFIAGYDKDEDVALAGQKGYKPSPDILASNVYINGISLEYTESSTSLPNTLILPGSAANDFPIRGAPAPFPYQSATFGGVQGQIRQPIISDPLPGTINGQRA